MTAQTRLQALESRHAQLDQRLHDIMTRPYWDNLEATRIKREKFLLKQEITDIRDRETNIYDMILKKAS